jgi:hypothetical protein
MSIQPIHHMAGYYRWMEPRRRHTMVTRSIMHPTSEPRAFIPNPLLGLTTTTHQGLTQATSPQERHPPSLEIPVLVGQFHTRTILRIFQAQSPTRIDYYTPSRMTGCQLPLVSFIPRSSVRCRHIRCRRLRLAHSRIRRRLRRILQHSIGGMPNRRLPPMLMAEFENGRIRLNIYHNS